MKYTLKSKDGETIKEGDQIVTNFGKATKFQAVEEGPVGPKIVTFDFGYALTVRDFNLAYSNNYVLIKEE